MCTYPMRVPAAASRYSADGVDGCGQCGQPAAVLVGVLVVGWQQSSPVQSSPTHALPDGGGGGGAWCVVRCTGVVQLQLVPSCCYPAIFQARLPTACLVLRPIPTLLAVLIPALQPVIRPQCVPVACFS